MTPNLVDCGFIKGFFALKHGTGNVAGIYSAHCVTYQYDSSTAGSVQIHCRAVENGTEVGTEHGTERPVDITPFILGNGGATREYVGMDTKFLEQVLCSKK